MKLTLALGHNSVQECQRHVSSREFAEWMAYDRLDPIGPERQDVMLAQIAWLLAETNRNKKKQKKAFKVTDFLPDWGTGRKQKEPAWKVMKDKMALLTALFNSGKDEEAQD